MKDQPAPADPPQDDAPLRAGPLEISLGYKLRLAQILAYRTFEERMTDFGVAPRYLGLLAIVGENPGQPQCRLADAVGVQKSSLVAILDRLESAGLLERRGSRTDRRAKTVWLTARGKRVAADLGRLARDHEDRMSEGISPDALRTTLGVLDAMIANLRGQSDQSEAAGSRAPAASAGPAA